MEKVYGSQKSGKTESYTVKAGDTLISIAEKIYGKSSESTFQDIYQANKDLIGDDPDQIKVGMTLKIPPKKINKII
ncbi:MAG: LysM peptidoglycan-binding domain-containing protein [Anaerolineales bacterium]|nr:LysM peptidoglycan-binding domain-containing protein [Anaerolineales bacterium]